MPSPIATTTESVIAVETTSESPLRGPRLCGLTVIDVESLSEGYARPDSWPVPALERAGIVMIFLTP